jgi:hypothetical protein
MVQNSAIIAANKRIAALMISTIKKGEIIK